MLHSNLDVGYGVATTFEKTREGMVSPTVIKSVKIVKLYIKQSNTGLSKHTAHHREVIFLLQKFEINMVNGWVRDSLPLPTNIRQLLTGVHISEAPCCRCEYICDFSS